MAVRVIITLVGISRDTVYFNNDIKMTLANLNASSVTQVSMILQMSCDIRALTESSKHVLWGSLRLIQTFAFFAGITQISALDTESKETIKIVFQDKFYGGKVIDERCVMFPLLHLARQDMRCFDNRILHSYSIAPPHCISIPQLCTRWSWTVTTRCPAPPIPRG